MFLRPVPAPNVQAGPVAQRAPSALSAYTRRGRDRTSVKYRASLPNIRSVIGGRLVCIAPIVVRHWADHHANAARRHARTRPRPTPSTRSLLPRFEWSLYTALFLTVSSRLATRLMPLPSTARSGICADAYRPAGSLPPTGRPCRAEIQLSATNPAWEGYRVEPHKGNLHV